MAGTPGSEPPSGFPAPESAQNQTPHAIAETQRAFEVPAGRCLSVAPGLPTRDIARTVEHYGRLGFTFSAPGSPSLDGAEFVIGQRHGIELHFALKPEHDPATTATWVYIGVEDADAMSEEFAAAGAERGHPVRNTDYQMREFAHVDPDGNLLLFGSPLSCEQRESDEPPYIISPTRAVTGRTPLR
jgi:predicted enzyme related to lactoylglutathione lyase